MTEKISSYDKIARHLMLLPDWNVMQQEFAKFLDSLHVTGCEHTMHRLYSASREDVSTQFVVEGFLSATPIKIVVDSLQYWNVADNFPSGELVSEAWLNEIVDRHFGKNKRQVPTYFCKKEKLEEKWPPLARQALIRDNYEKVGETVTRLRAEWLALETSPEKMAGRAQCYELYVIDKIKKVMIQYASSVSPEVLKTALDEYCAHAIMES